MDTSHPAKLNPKNLNATNNKDMLFKKLHRHSTIRKESIFAWKKNRSHAIKEFEAFSDKTGLHGFKYVGDVTITYFERFFWLVSITAAGAFAAYFITMIYEKYNNNPVIISLTPTPVSISSIPFPAVTVCNLNQAMKKQAQQIIKEGTDWQRLLLDDYCNSNSTTINETAATKQTGSWEYVKGFIRNISQPCSEMFTNCKWKRNDINCNDLFKTYFTDDGLCCTFNRLPEQVNMRDHEESEEYLDNKNVWSPQKGYANPLDDDTIPWRAEGSGSHMGLTIVLNSSIDNFYCSSTLSVGFKIMLSNPMETPKMADFGFLVTPGAESRIVIVPSMNDATSTLRSIDVIKRQCFFPEERWLRYYRLYSQKNCRLECQANYTLRECGCVPYFLPKQTNVTICGKSQEVCVDKMKERMDSILVSIKQKYTCNCLKSCYELSYSKELTYGRLDQRSLPQYMLRDVTSDYFVKNMAVVSLYFNENVFLKFTKSELYGFSDFLSSTGGLLGLFLGFSFLSVVEVVYYLSIRIFCFYNRNKNKNKHKKADKNTIYPFVN